MSRIGSEPWNFLPRSMGMLAARSAVCPIKSTASTWQKASAEYYAHLIADESKCPLYTPLFMPIAHVMSPWHNCIAIGWPLHSVLHAGVAFLWRADLKISKMREALCALANYIVDTFQ